MQKNFTRYMKLLLLLLCSVLGTAGAHAQYTPIQMATGGFYTGVACDNEGHVYALRRNSGGTKYEVVKYLYGGPASTVIYDNLVFNAAANIFPWGISVNDQGTVFVTNPVSQWDVIKLTPGAGGVYTPQVVQSGGWISALTKGFSNGLMAIDFRLDANAHRFQVYPAGQEDGMGSHLQFPTTVPFGAVTYPWGAGFDKAANLYAIDRHENNGGQIIRINAQSPAGGYKTHDLIGAGKYYTALAIDKDDNFYTTEKAGGTYRVVKRTDIMDPTGELLLDNLSTNGAALPWGLAVNQWGQVFVGDGSSATGGRLVKLTPPINVVSVTGNGNLRTNANSVTYTVTLSAPATNVTIGDFYLGSNGLTNPGITSVVQTGATTYTVTVNTGTGSGDLQLMVSGDGMIPKPANVPFTAGDVFVIDKTPPYVGLVIPPGNGTYRAGDVLNFKVSYTEKTTITGSPSLPVTIGSNTVQATYASGTGTVTHIFSYTVQPGDMDLDGIALSASIALNGGSIRDEAGNNLVPALNNVPATTGVRVNTATPAVTLSTTATSPVRQPFTVTATFSEAVTGLTLSDFNATNATVSNLATSDNITYTMTVTPTADGLVTLQLPADKAQNTGLNGNTASNVLSLTYDGTKPTVTSVTPPATRTYKAFDVLDFKVNFDEDVIVTGTPTLSITIGSTTVQIARAGVAIGNSVSFGYTVQSGQLDLDGVTLNSTSISLNGATIRDVAGNDANVTLNNAGATSGVLVDAVAPVVNSVQVPANGNYVTNNMLHFTVQMSENVTVAVPGGLPYLDVTIGSTTLRAPYSGGTGSNALTFSHMVQANEQDLDGIALGNIGLNGSTIRDAAGNNAVITLNNAGSTSGVFVNAARPSVTLTTSATSPVNGAFSFNIKFSEAVTNFTAARMIATNATVSNLQTADNITYTALATPTAAGAIAISVPADAAKSAANAGNTASNTLFLEYDNTAPTIDAVTVPLDRIYRRDDLLLFSMVFSEPVNGTGTPSFDITIGSTVRQAVYTGGMGSRTLTFLYVVQDGDLDMDGITVGNLLKLNNGTIRDAAGNNASLAMNNIPGTANIWVNTVTPRAILSAIPAANAPTSVTVSFDEKVTGLALTDFEVTNATLSNLQTADGITYTLLLTPLADGGVSIHLPAGAAQNVGGNGNLPSNTIAYTYDGTAPAITAVTVPADKTYRTGESLAFTVIFSEPISTTGPLSIDITVGSTVRQAVFTQASDNNKLTFSYTVQSGDLDLDGITVGSQLNLNGGSIRDAAGNGAALAMNNTGNTSGVLVNTQRPTVTLTAPTSGRVNAPVTVTLAFSEAVTGLAATDVAVTNGTAGNLQTTNNITYTALITPAADGMVSVSLPADAAANIAGNGNNASNSISFTYDATAPVITAGQRFTIHQYSPAGTTVGQVNANAGSDALQNWALSATGAFEITNTGLLRVKDAALLGPLGGTTVTLQVTVSDGLNTSAATPVSVQVDLVNQAPTLDPITSVSSCADTETRTIQLTGASATEPAQTYTITATASADVFDQLSVNTSNVLTYRLKAGATPGSTTVTVTIRDNGGTANGGIDALQRSFTVTVTAPPTVSISSDKGATISKGDVVRLTAAGGNSYVWTDAAGIIGERRNATLEVRPMDNITYTVTATNAAGCAGTANISIAVLNDFKVDATNILTPNGDGRNDRWVVRNIDSYPDNEVKIFDRTGRIVYQRRNYSNDWAGTANGSPLAEGTYYYILTINNGAATAKGYITIVRDVQ